MTNITVLSLVLLIQRITLRNASIFSHNEHVQSTNTSISVLEDLQEEAMT